jgi:hypothetical protein
MGVAMNERDEAAGLPRNVTRRDNLQQRSSTADTLNRDGAMLLAMIVLCLCAVITPLFSLMSIFRPEDEPLGQWFQRAGIVMTVFAMLAHFKAAGVAAAMIAGTTFAETWEAYHKYNMLQTRAVWLSLVLIVVGTLIWAYGDLLFPEPADDTEEQNAIVWCRPATRVCMPRFTRG